MALGAPAISFHRSLIRCEIAEPSGKPAPMGQKTRYKDSIFDRAFMSLFSRKMESATGMDKILTWFISSLYDLKKSDVGRATNKPGYDGFVDVSRGVLKGRTPVEQRALVRQVFLSIMPPGAPETFRKLFPPTKWACEFNAAITVPFFQWLVGPCETFEVEVNGVKQNSGVKILKCRYLENSSCAGMCVNVCKIPTQDLFTNDFGLPLTMTPNFEDMSCEMIYGLQPPSLEEDPALKQPCLERCKFLYHLLTNCSLYFVKRSNFYYKANLHKTVEK
ncbi:hypothetical protein SELMODRAFT_103815 [Selaginella moellendorffii]|uniref:Beta-carotene isomerase D27-like C-terminal domain-containing protein n=1 Tax=Selaginella moellendorffii TaxID=88036 RepID=D8RX25_SELML|nr:hypothetical protein SELMODRAFT_103815 [Selaginella moellendorffii]